MSTWREMNGVSSLLVSFNSSSQEKPSVYYIGKGDMDKFPKLTNPPTDKHCFWMGSP